MSIIYAIYLTCRKWSRLAKDVLVKKWTSIKYHIKYSKRKQHQTELKQTIMEQHKNYLEKPKLAMELNLKGIEIVCLYIYIYI